MLFSTLWSVLLSNRQNREHLQCFSNVYYLTIDHSRKYKPKHTIMLFVCHPTILHKHCLQFLLGVKMAPRKTENNPYAKFWDDNKEHYGMLWHFLGWSIAHVLYIKNSNITPRLSGNFSIFGLVFFVFKSLWELQNNGVVKNLRFGRSHVRILIYS